MNHSTIPFSESETHLLERSVGEIVAENPMCSRVFQNFGIDFCCQGAKTLREACERKNVDPKAVTEQLKIELADKKTPINNPAKLPIPELIAYIIETHHSYLRRELPRLHGMSEKVANVHGGHTPSLLQVFQIFTGMEQELNQHMMKEEQILFPAILAINQQETVPVSLEGPISCMIHEHEDAGIALARMRQLTNGFQPPADACNTYRALFAGLLELEKDLHYHIHLENNVLFPAARTLASQA